MPITLEGISMEDNYEDDYLTRRALIYTLNFTCKTFLFGPINNSSEGLIKKVQTDFYSDTTNLKTAPRQVRYQAVPVAVKDYNQDDTARTNEVFDDKVTSFGVNSSTPFAKGNFIQIDDEVMLISSINANRLTVKRGQYGTAIVPHDINIPVNAITIQDNEAIVDGDDFGFGVTKSEYADGQVFSVSQQTDAEL
tara:strand:- start:976 stop:1557 length:582 start_codon:yes stop_codon:yes gene_type:complete